MKKRRLISSSILVFVIFLSLMTASFAWLANFINVDTQGEFSGSSIAAYFADGDGSADDPYIISNSKHLYNLSWLQNKKAFGNEKYYFKVCKIEGTGDNIQHVPTTIDMAGAIYGSDEEGRSGAIPPIGDKENPFIGYFDGFGSTIENLWVSTLKDDWKEQPEGVGDYAGKYVGLFGAIGQEAIVEDFILDKIEVKSHITDAKIGIICGYVDAMLKNVGVYNGIINVSAGSGATSDYSLIGEKNPRIVWDDMPTIDSSYDEGVEGGDEAGGVIRVDINDNELVNLFTGSGSIGNNSEKALGATYKEITVTGAAPKRSYLVGDVTASQHQKVESVYIYTTSISSRNGYDGNGYKEIRGNSFGDIDDSDNDAFEQITASSYLQYKDALSDRGITYNEDFYKRLGALPGKPKVIKTGDSPFESGSIETVNITFDENTKLDVPTNGIWFKPMAPGPSIISFSISNKGGGEKYRSIYRFKRENGVITSWTETKLVFNSSFANCDIIAFEFYIDQLDVDEEYEYLIGTSRNDNNDSAVSFVFLALAGASDTGGGEDTPVSRPTEPGTFAEIMYDVDYVISPTVDISADTYENHQTLLRIDAAVGGSKLYYLAAGELGSSRVYYTLPTGCQITDISSGKMSATVGKNETFAGKNFEEREEIKDENSP